MALSQVYTQAKVTLQRSAQRAIYRIYPPAIAQAMSTYKPQIGHCFQKQI